MAEVFTETIDIKRIEFEKDADGTETLVHIYEQSPRGRKFDSLFEDKIELAHDFEDAKRVVVSFTRKKWRGGWNYYIEDLAEAPDEDQVVEQSTAAAAPVEAPASAAESVAASLVPMVPADVSDRVITLLSIEHAITVAKMPPEERAFVAVLLPVVIDTFKTGGGAESLARLREVLGVPAAQGKQPPATSEAAAPQAAGKIEVWPEGTTYDAHLDPLLVKREAADWTEPPVDVVAELEGRAA